MGPVTQVTLWNDKHTSELFRIVNAPMPLGCQGTICPTCNAASVIAAVVVRGDGTHVVDSADEHDPDLVCTTCGYWWD